MDTGALCLLLSANANPNLTARGDHLPIFVAILRQNVPAVQVLVAARAHLQNGRPPASISAVAVSGTRNERAHPAENRKTTHISTCNSYQLPIPGRRDKNSPCVVETLLLGNCDPNEFGPILASSLRVLARRICVTTSTSKNPALTCA